MNWLPIAPRTFACVECGTERTCATNHDGECYPVCRGKCRTIVNPHTAREVVLPANTPHRYVREGRHDQPAPCDHDWQQEPGMGGLIDKCSKCGEERA